MLLTSVAAQGGNASPASCVDDTMSTARFFAPARLKRRELCSSRQPAAGQQAICTPLQGAINGGPLPGNLGDSRALKDLVIQRTQAIQTLLLAFRAVEKSSLTHLIALRVPNVTEML